MIGYIPGTPMPPGTGEQTKRIARDSLPHARRFFFFYHAYHVKYRFALARVYLPAVSFRFVTRDINRPYPTKIIPSVSREGEIQTFRRWIGS